MAAVPMQKAAELTAYWNALQQDKSAITAGVNQFKGQKANLEAKVTYMQANLDVFTQDDIDAVQAGLTWMESQVDSIFPA